MIVLLLSLLQEAEFEFTSCMTVTRDPPVVATCNQGLVDMSFPHGLRILDTAALAERERYRPGSTTYFARKCTGERGDGCHTTCNLASNALNGSPKYPPPGMIWGVI